MTASLDWELFSLSASLLPVVLGLHKFLMCRISSLILKLAADAYDTRQSSMNQLL